MRPDESRATSSITGWVIGRLDRDPAAGHSGGAGDGLVHTITNFSSAGIPDRHPGGRELVHVQRDVDTINTFSTSGGNATGMIVLTPATRPTSQPPPDRKHHSGLEHGRRRKPVGISLGSSVATTGFFWTRSARQTWSADSRRASPVPLRSGSASTPFTRTANVFRNKVYDIQVTGRRDRDRLSAGRDQ